VVVVVTGEPAHGFVGGLERGSTRLVPQPGLGLGDGRDLAAMQVLPAGVGVLGRDLPPVVVPAHLLEPGLVSPPASKNHSTFK